ncbi:MAG: hypothetical protein ACR2JK_05910 [Geodermatophilaceae bacterium]
MDTQTRRTDLDPATSTNEPDRRPLLDLSLTQIAGGSLAAASGAGLASTLGVAGTLVGAVTISVVTAVGGAFYTQSLRRTRERVRAGTQAALRRATATTPATTPAPVGPVRATRSVLQPRSLAVGAAAVFGLAIAGITGYELATGAPISGGSGGTTLGEVTGNGPAAADTPPAERIPSSDPDQPTDGTSESAPATSVSPTSAPNASSTTAAPTTSPAEPTSLTEPTSEPSATSLSPTVPPPPSP